MTRSLRGQWGPAPPYGGGGRRARLAAGPDYRSVRSRMGDRDTTWPLAAGLTPSQGHERPKPCCMTPGWLGYCRMPSSGNWQA